MKVVKLIGILFLAYVVLVVAFESMIGYFQPGGEDTLVISTTAADGSSNDRVLSRLESDGQLFVAANHWPRAWYRQALENPQVQVTLGEVKGPYLAVPATEQEHERVHRENNPGLVFRILTGFPPRYFVRLDPR